MVDHCAACGPTFEHWLDADPVCQAAWRALPRRPLARGEQLQTVGQPVRALWFVERGLLRSYYLNADGRERNSAFHAEGQWAGTPAPQGGVPCAAWAVDALERSQVVELGHAVLAGWLQQRPQWHGILTDALSAHMLALSRREATLLMDSAEQRYLQWLQEQPLLATRVALHQVASYLGVTNVALSRLRRRLKNRQADLCA